MDLWSRWLDQPVESDTRYVEDDGPCLVGAAIPNAIPGPTTAALSSDDHDQRPEDDSPKEQAQLSDETTILVVDTATTSAPSAPPPDEPILPAMTLEDFSPNLPARSTVDGLQSLTKSKGAPPEETVVYQQENDCFQPGYPKPPGQRQSLDGYLYQMSDSLSSRFRPTTMSRPTRASPSVASSTYYVPAGRRTKRPSMASPSKRTSQQYVSHRTSYLSATTQQTTPADDPASWKVWEDQLGSDGLLAHANGGLMVDEDGKPELMYPCPFRRRNPARFNVRDHTHCAKTLFGTIAELRLHVTSYHRRQRVLHQCRRCKMGFESEAFLDQHMMLPKDQICESIPEEANADPEDGITDSVDRQLVMGQADVETWEGIWQIVFPGDQDVPAPDFYPIIELVEVEQLFDDSQEALKASLQETLRLFLPPNIDSDFCRFLAGQLELTFETHRANTTRTCLNQFSPTTPHTPLLSPKPIDPTSLTRTQSRRSRRSTRLFGTSIPNTPALRASPTGEGDDEISLPLNQIASPQLQPHPSATHSSKRTSRILVSLPQNATRPLTLTQIVSPHTPATRSIGDDQSEYDCSRESRDSGIGMPCEVCDMEACQCRQALSTLTEGKGKVPSRQTKPVSSKSKTAPTTALPQPTLSTARDAAQQKLRHQPNLRVKTAISNSTFPTNKPYSPQSFKQRVMRKRESKFADDDPAI